MIGDGGVAATSNVAEAAVGSTWCSRSRARTLSVCTPSGESRPTQVSSDLHGDQGAESSEIENWTPSTW